MRCRTALIPRNSRVEARFLACIQEPMSTAALDTTKALGNSDMNLTAIGSQDDNDSLAAIRRALDGGTNWIDTAAVYRALRRGRWSGAQAGFGEAVRLHQKLHDLGRGPEDRQFSQEGPPPGEHRRHHQRTLGRAG